MLFLAALEDEKLSRALTQIHGEPEKKWTLEEMARVAGMSRSIFAERFNALMKVPPAEYLTRWRMLRAKAALDTGKETIARIAAMTGYRSEAAFSTAFKRPDGACKRAAFPGTTARVRSSVIGCN